MHSLTGRKHHFVALELKRIVGPDAMVSAACAPSGDERIEGVLVALDLTRQVLTQKQRLSEQLRMTFAERKRGTIFVATMTPLSVMEL